MEKLYIGGPEVDVMLSDGRVVRVSGKLAVDYKRNPEAVRKFVEEERARMERPYIGGVDQVFVKQEFMDLTDPSERARLVAEATVSSPAEPSGTVSEIYLRPSTWLLRRLRGKF